MTTRSGRTTIKDTDGGHIAVMPSSGVAASYDGKQYDSPFIWLTITPGHMSAPCTVHLTGPMVTKLHIALDAALKVLRAKRAEPKATKKRGR